MQQISELRENNEDVYSLFLARFVQHTVGVQRFKNRIIEFGHDGLTTHQAEKLCTPSDEAFTLIVMENNYNRWLDIVKRNNWKIPDPVKKKVDMKKQFLSNERPKFTSGGNIYTDGDNVKTKGWSQAGIEKFNRIYEKVKEDRRRNPDFLKNFILEEKEKLQKPNVRRARTVHIPEFQAKHDDFSDWEDDGENNAVAAILTHMSSESGGNRQRRVMEDDDDDDESDEDVSK